MIRNLALGVILLAAADGFAAAARIRTPIVMYVGQEIRHTTGSPLLTVSLAPSRESTPVTFRFDRYGHNVTLIAKSTGDAKLLCEHADNRIGEVLLVTVVSREAYERYERTVGAMSALEGLDRRDIIVAGSTVIVSGRVYSQRDLQACAALETPRRNVVCGARLASASFVVQPHSAAMPRASLEIEEQADTMESSSTSGIEGRSKWVVTIRVGDVPVFSLASLERQSVLVTAATLVRGLNQVAGKWRANAEESGRPYPVSFRITPNGDRYDVTSLWNYEQGSRRERLATVRAGELHDAVDAARVAPGRLVGWWAALIEDAFRCYYNAERPARSSTSRTRSPVVALYEDALKLHGSSLDRDTAAAQLSRAYFASHLIAGADPFAKTLTSVPADFAADVP